MFKCCETVQSGEAQPGLLRRQMNGVFYEDIFYIGRNMKATPCEINFELVNYINFLTLSSFCSLACSMHCFCFAFSYQLRTKRPKKKLNTKQHLKGRSFGNTDQSS